ncbi:MAG: ABC transporter permease [Candidatus Aenigmatarchaeota archaeon]
MRWDETEKILKNIWSNYRQFLILTIIIIISYCISPTFLSHTNLFYLLRVGSIIGIAAIGMMFTVLTGGIDLSISSMAALSCVLVAYFEHWNIYLGHVEQLSFIAPLPIIYLMCLGIGATFGLLWGFIISKWNLPDFAVTLAGMFILKGISYRLPAGQTIFGVDEITIFIGAGEIGFIPFSLLVWAIVCVVAHIILNYTIVGKHTYAYGGNPPASKICGVSPLKVKMFAYAICGLLASLVGIIYAGRTNTGDYRVGEELMLNALMAVLLGGTNIFGGEGKIPGTIIGTIIVAMIFNVFDLTKLHPYPRDVLRGLMLIIIIILLIKGEKFRKA